MKTNALHRYNCTENHAIAPALEPNPEKILRPSIFVGRAKALDIRTPLKALLHDPIFTGPRVDGSAAPWILGHWVLAMAEALASRCSVPVPARWLDKLALAFDVTRAQTGAPLATFDCLQRAVWNEPALLGEWLAAAREFLLEPVRLGRSDRISMGSIYTPAAVAKAIVAEVHVGSRRVVDPACGAGVFLLEVFQRAYKRRLEGGAPPLEAATAALSHELVGIDIDGHALAVAEFSLRITALRCANLDQDAPIDLRLANALEPLTDLDGNCECVVGNPPFVEGRGLSTSELKDLRKRFRCASTGKVNLFAVFVERALSLLKEDGVLAFILPATFQRNTRYRMLRELLLEHTLEAIKPLDPHVFGERIVETVVLRVRKKPPTKSSRVKMADGNTLQSRLPMGPVLRFCDRLPRGLRRQVELMERHGVQLSEYFEVKDGISTGFQPFPLRLLGTVGTQSTGSVSELLFTAADGTRTLFNPGLHRKIIDGSEFHAYTPVHWAGRHIEYDKAHEHFPAHPGRSFNCQLREHTIFDRAEKLLTRQTARGFIATIDRERYFVRNSVHVTFIKEVAGQHDLFEQRSQHAALSLDALCACLNSRFYTDYLLAVTGEKGRIFPQIHIADIKRLPILPGLLGSAGELSKWGAELLGLFKIMPLQNSEIEIRKSAAENLLAAAFGVAD